MRFSSPGSLAQLALWTIMELRLPTNGASFLAAGSRLVGSVVMDSVSPSETMMISPCVSVR